MDELVSILIPFKNTEQYLEECLDSIINQTYKNWELLIVDDNSTDNSLAIVTTFVNKDKRIKLFSNNENGIIRALRLAFEMSSGKYVTRMDSDDYMPKHKIEMMVNDLSQYGKNHIALGLVNYFSANGIGEGYSKYENWLNKLTEKGLNYSEIYKECVIPSPCWMVHRTDLLECEAFEPNRYPEDYDLAFRFYKYGLICIPSNSILHYWRDYRTRTSRTDAHYTQNYFLELKLHYFLDLEYDASRPLAVWGAGFKGKSIAKMLVNKGIPFNWICDNPNKIGRHIYNQKLLDFQFLKEIAEPQSIITVANEMAQIEIRSYLSENKMKPMLDYFFFC